VLDLAVDILNIHSDNSTLASDHELTVLFKRLLNWCCSLNIFNTEKSVGGDVKKFITSSFFNRITFHLAVRCRTFQEINL